MWSDFQIAKKSVLIYFKALNAVIHQRLTCAQRTVTRTGDGLYAEAAEKSNIFNNFAFFLPISENPAKSSPRTSSFSNHFDSFHFSVLSLLSLFISLNNLVSIALYTRI